MKKAITYLMVMVLGCVWTAAAAEMPQDSINIYLKSGGVDVFPKEVLKDFLHDGKGVTLTLKNDSVISYPAELMDSVNSSPLNFPKFTSFKFNNKYNDDVYVDVFAKIGKDSVTASVPAIGKWLTPSFRLSDPRAQVFVGNELQVSKVSRRRFEQPVKYTVTVPGFRKMDYQLVQDEIWSEGSSGDPIVEPVTLTPMMLSTNAPSNRPVYEGLDKMIDGDYSTYFHSTWGSGDYQKLPLDEWPYLQVDLYENIQDFIFRYTTRADLSMYCPLGFLIKYSKDGVNWYKADSLGVEDGLPTVSAGADFESAVIHLPEAAPYVRFYMTRGEHKNYLVFTEFSMAKYKGATEPTPPQLISPAVYQYDWRRMGNDYTVKIDWPTDRAKNVPAILINVENGEEITDKKHYKKASFRLDGAGVFADMNDSILIRGRGNISWGRPKKPYRIKFATAVKPFGLTKGKNWVLLANNQDGSLLVSAIGMKIARMVGTAGANDMIPVELYLNGKYQGSYNLTQQVGIHNNSIDAPDARALMLELDSYNEPDQFMSSYYYLPVNVKNPDLDELTMTQKRQVLDRAQKDFDEMTKAVKYGNGYEDLVNVTMLARYLMVSELVHNTELKHPKSVFLFKEDYDALESKFVFGPIWDLDWGFGYESERANYTYCLSDPTWDFFRGISQKGNGGTFFYDLLNRSEVVKRAYYKEWKLFVERHMEEMRDYITDYYEYARPSLEHNAQKWNDGYGYASIAQEFKDWLTERAEYVFQHLPKYDLETPEPIRKGDVNLDGAISLADVVCINNYLLNLENEQFDLQQADMDGDGAVGITDIVWLFAKMMQQEDDPSRFMGLAPAEAVMVPQGFTAHLGTTAEWPLDLEIAGDNYTATQFDVHLPQGMTLEEVVLPADWEDAEVETAELEQGGYRVAVYSAQGKCFPQGSARLSLWVRPEQTIASEERVASVKAATLITHRGEEERMGSRSAAFDMEVTGLDAQSGTEAVTGGDALHVEALSDGEVRVMGTDGRLLKVCGVKAGKNRIELPAGVYIVNQKKVVVNQ